MLEFYKVLVGGLVRNIFFTYAKKNKSESYYVNFLIEQVSMIL